MARILVVDDQPINRELIHAYLEDSGHVLVDAESGEQAFARAEQQPPDLVLLDVMMPGLNGYETTRRLKDQSGEKFLPIILLTSLNDLSSRLIGFQMGADEFLTKPVDRQELIMRVGNLLALRAKDIALMEKNVALAEVDRFKDEMSALLIHDLKNPLCVMLANYSYVAEGLRGLDPSYLEALADSEAAGQRIIRLLANLYDLATLEANRLSLRRKSTNLATLLNEIATQRRLLARSRKITLEVIANSELSLSIDADLLTRVVENIVDNSLRYTPADGRVQLEASVQSSRAEIRIGNTGVPIPVEARTLIFEKFAQATPGTGRMNLGLGLYFCRLAVEAHGGNIWVEETATLPTVFVMHLPA